MLTCDGTWLRQKSFLSNLFPLQEALNLLLIHGFISNVESRQFTLHLPLRTFSNACQHLAFLEVLIKSPGTNLSLILSFAAEISTSVHAFELGCEVLLHGMKVRK